MELACFPPHLVLHDQDQDQEARILVQASISRDLYHISRNHGENSGAVLTESRREVEGRQGTHQRIVCRLLVSMERHGITSRCLARVLCRNARMQPFYTSSTTRSLSLGSIHLDRYNHANALRSSKSSLLHRFCLTTSVDDVPVSTLPRRLGRSRINET